MQSFIWHVASGSFTQKEKKQKQNYNCFSLHMKHPADKLTASFLVWTIFAIIFSIALPTIMDTAAIITLKFSMLTSGTAGRATYLIRIILAIIVTITLPSTLYAPSITTGKLCWTTSFVSCKLERMKLTSRISSAVVDTMYNENKKRNLASARYYSCFSNKSGTKTFSLSNACDMLKNFNFHKNYYNKIFELCSQLTYKLKELFFACR